MVLKGATTVKTYSASDVQAIVEKNIESDLPDQVLAVLKQFDGKQLTKRILPKLPGGEDVWRIDQIANMTSLVTREYINTRGNAGTSLLIAYATKNVTIDCEKIEGQFNPSYFEGRRERNAERALVLKNEGPCIEMAYLLNNACKARDAWLAAKARVEALTEYKDGPFSADRYTFRDLIKIEGDK